MIYDHWEQKAIEQAEKEYSECPLYFIYPASMRVKYSNKKRRLLFDGIEAFEATIKPEQVEYVRQQVEAGKTKIRFPFANESQKMCFDACRPELREAGVRVSKKNVILSLPSA